MQNKLSTEGVSIVVCCYNSAEVIVPTVTCLAEQDIPSNLQYELIVVDNNCVDDSIDLAMEVWHETPYAMKVVKERKQGLIHARKRGVIEASFDIVLCVDDDNLLDPDFVKKVHSLFMAKPNVGVIGGNVIPYLDSVKPDWLDEYLGVYACGPQAGKSGPVTYTRMMLVGAGLAFRATILKEIISSNTPLFLVGRTGDVMLRGEDAELCMISVLMGWELWYEASLIVRHYLPPKRLDWHYVLDVRRGGGAADVILDMYRRMIKRRAPRTYKELSLHICKEWKDYWRTVTNLSCLELEGSKKRFQYAFLQGLTEGFLSRSEGEYRDIRHSLMNRYLRNAPERSRSHRSSINGELIVTVADENFIDQAKQLFASIYYNAGWTGDYMLLSAGIPKKELHWFEAKGILVKECDAIVSPGHGRNPGDKWPSAVLNSLYLFKEEFKRWKTIVYLDGDMIVRGSLHALLQTNGFAAVQGLFAIQLRDRIIDCRKDISRGQLFSLLRRYGLFSPSFNGGILVINTEVIKKRTFNDLVELVGKYSGPLTRNEEAVLNFYFHRKWKKLPCAYNVYVNSLRKPELAKGIVLHFMRWKGERCERPWNPESLFYEEWTQNLRNADNIDLSVILDPKERWSKTKTALVSALLKLMNMRFYYKTVVIWGIKKTIRGKLKTMRPRFHKGDPGYGPK